METEYATKGWRAGQGQRSDRPSGGSGRRKMRGYGDARNFAFFGNCAWLSVPIG